MKNASDGLITRLDTAKKRISGLEDTSVETPKTEKQREQRPGKNKTKQNKVSNDCETTTKSVTYM